MTPTSSLTLDRPVAAQPLTTDHPVAPGSTEDYLNQCRQALALTEKLTAELLQRTDCVCRPIQEAQAVQGSIPAPSPASAMADVFAQGLQQITLINNGLNSILSRLDLP